MTVRQAKLRLPKVDPVAWSLPLFAFILLAVEEFPSGLGEMGQEGVERSTRTAFYAKSLGVSGLYAPDIALVGLGGLLVLAGLILRRKRWLQMDMVGAALTALIGMMTLSTVLSLAGGDPFAGAVPHDSATTLYTFNDRALKLIALFQIKNFVLILPAYLCGLMYLDRPARLDALLMVFPVGCLVLAAEGFVRLARHPSVVLHGSPLFYDSPSSWFFALFAFWVISAWGWRVLSLKPAAMLAAASLVLALFVLISFRRTMWGGIAISAVLVIAALPSLARRKIIVGGATGMAVLGAVVIASPIGKLIIDKVGQRIHETGGGDMSTIYRLAMFVHFFKNGDDTPFFGWGVKPLWNKLFQFGYITFNLENMHSLYFWLWLRMGAAGFTVAVVVYLSLLGRAAWVYQTARTPKGKVVAMGLVTMLFIFLFSGVFNPVYGEVRYIVPLGFALAVLTRLPQFERMRAAAP